MEQLKQSKETLEKQLLPPSTRQVYFNSRVVTIKYEKPKKGDKGYLKKRALSLEESILVEKAAKKGRKLKKGKCIRRGCDLWALMPKGKYYRCAEHRREVSNGRAKAYARKIRFQKTVHDELVRLIDDGKLHSVIESIIERYYGLRVGSSTSKTK